MRITDLLNRETVSVAKRLAEKSAWVAHINSDGNVNLSHERHDDIYLSSRDELNEWIKENDLGEWRVIVIDVVNTKGEPPKEL